MSSHSIPAAGLACGLVMLETLSIQEETCLVTLSTFSLSAFGIL